jgi:hypothetical protein
MPKRQPNKAKASATTGVAVRALGPAATDFGEEIRPLGRELGRATVRTVRALLKPLSGLVWGFEQIEDWVSETVASKLQAVPSERRVEPRLMLAGPLLESMKYCGSEPHLRDLFANLLVTSMDAARATNAHPAFVEMIKQLSPDEARILHAIARTFHQSYGVIYVYRAWDALKMNTTTGETEVRTAEVFGPYVTIGRYAACDHLSLMPGYITNLVRLQIVGLHVPSGLTEEERDDLEDDIIIRSKVSEIEKFGHRPIYRTGYIETTALGRQFFDACVTPPLD